MNIIFITVKEILKVISLLIKQRQRETKKKKKMLFYYKETSPMLGSIHYKQKQESLIDGR